MLQIIRCAFPYSSSTPSPPLPLLSPPHSLSLSLSHSPTLPLSPSLFPINSRVVRLQASPKRADHLSTSEYWKPATGAVEHNKSFS